MTQSLTTIEHLFPALPPGAFVERYYPNKPYRCHAAVARLGPIASEPVLQDPLALIRAARGETLVGYLRTADGKRHQAVVTKATAIAMFGAGMTVDISSLHLSNSAVGEWVEALRRELGLGRGQIMCDAVVSPPGDAVPKHFDGIETLSVQILGRKRWRIASCPDVRFPSHSVFPALTHNWRDGERRLSYAPASFDVQMPKDSRVFLMKPGSVVFLPRGWWHETTALEPSISLSVVLRPEPWAAMVTRVLSDTLEADAEWRAPVPLATPRQRSLARRRLAELLAALPEKLGTIRPAGVIPLSAAEERFRPVRGVRFRSRAAARGVVCRLESAELSRPLEIETEPEVARAIEWMARSRRPFARATVEAIAPGLKLGGILGRLVKVGLLVRLPASTTEVAAS
jgi:ribosomal protein L16 Arg81 hydroxylase